MKKLKILHLRDTHEIGGPGKTILETHRAIDRARFELHLGVFLTRKESGESPFTREARRLDMPVHFLRGLNQYDPRLVRLVVKLAERLDIDIVHAHEVKSDVITFLASQLHTISIVTTLHGWIGNGLKQRALTVLDKCIVRGFDRVIVVSRQIERELVASGVPSHKIRLLHNAIVAERYCRKGQKGLLTEAIGRPISNPVIASIGRLSREKGHADLIAAAKILSDGGHKITVVLIGDGPERVNLHKMIRIVGLEDSIHLPGYIQEPHRMLEEIDLMVLPSHTEGLPNAVLEALLMEVPVLATAVGGTPEIIDDQQTGRLVPSQSPEALARGIQEFIADPQKWKSMASRGKEVVKKNFDFQARTRRLEAIYEEMMGQC